MKNTWSDVILALFVLLVCLAGYLLVDNGNEVKLIKPRHQIVTIKNNGQEIVYYVDGKQVVLGYEDKE